MLVSKRFSLFPRHALGLAVVLAAFAGCDGCDDETAKTPECPAGQSGCPCGEQNGCDDGLVCQNDVCTGAVTRGIVISDERARACEFLVGEKDGAHLVKATFDASLRGTFVAERPKVAVSFTATADEPIAADAVGLVQADGVGSLAITQSSCFDAKGAVLAGATVSLADSP